MPDENLMRWLAKNRGWAVMKISYGQETSMAGGEPLVRELRAQKWALSVNCPVLSPEEGVTVQAMIGALGGSKRTFYAFDPARVAPLADPDGSVLGSATPAVLAFNSNANLIRLSGLPAGYKLSVGDYFSYPTPSGQALHQVTQEVVAASNGTTSAFGIHPPVRAGMAGTPSVRLLAPIVEMRIVPGSIKPDGTAVASSLSFEAMQVTGNA